MLIIPFSFSVFSELYRFSLDLDRNKEKSNHIENLKIHSQEINIISPENKTYTEPMSGYYPATYSYENDDVDASGTNINFIDTDSSTGSSTASIVEQEEGHKKVLKLNDVSTNYVDIYNNFSSQASGTVEFWACFEDVTKDTGFELRESSTRGVHIKINDNKIQYYYSGSWHDATSGSVSNDIWYHFKIAFDVSTDTYSFYLNGNLLDSPIAFRSVLTTGVDRIRIYTDATDSNYISYIDAVGYSWDSNYNIGDNLHEGLLVSFNLELTPAWLGYSLDGLGNKTILGNTSINLPDSGIHSIQVYGNNTIGSMFESDVRYFTMCTGAPYIRINQPNEDEFFGSTAPAYEISINCPYDSIWYTLDGGINNITSNSLTGTISQVEWDKKGEGIVTITFYANNTKSLIGSAEVSIIKSLSKDDKGVIPGYNLLSIFGITLGFSLISGIIIKNKFKN